MNELKIFIVYFFLQLQAFYEWINFSSWYDIISIRVYYVRLRFGSIGYLDILP